VLSVGTLGFAFSTTAVALDLSRFLQGAGTAAAWVAASYHVADRGGAMGAAFAGAFAGIVVGPAIGAAAASSAGSSRS
jgi:MFS family permease